MGLQRKPGVANKFGDLSPEIVAYNGIEYQVIVLSWYRGWRHDGNYQYHRTALDFYTYRNRIPDGWILRVRGTRFHISEGIRATIGAGEQKVYWTEPDISLSFAQKYDVTLSREIDAPRDPDFDPLADLTAEFEASDDDTAATDLTWSITGGADRAKFAITSAGALTFATAKDFEAPDDADTDGIYEVTVRVSDGDRSDTANIQVTLSNRNEAPTAAAGVDQVGIEEGATVTQPPATTGLADCGRTARPYGSRTSAPRRFSPTGCRTRLGLQPRSLISRRIRTVHRLARSGSGRTARLC